VDHPRYLIIDVLGHGGMGTVYRAQHRLMQRVVALKVINSSLVQRPDMVRRFHKEVRVAASLCHPNIVTAYDADSAGAIHFFVMEYVEGVNLDVVLTRQGPLPVAVAADYARQVALALQHAATRGMTHGDVKPHNLMLTPQGQVKVLDFGLARFLSERLLEAVDETAFMLEGGSAFFPVDVEEMMAHAPTLTARAGLPGLRRHHLYTGAGTADYIAPEEVLDPRLADVRSDIYSLGCTLYRLLSGRVPFPGGGVKDKLKAHLGSSPPPLGDLPPPLAQVVGRMMAKERAERYQNAGEVADALAPFACVRKGQVLLVDDDDVARTAMRMVLEASGFTVREATNGREALQRLRAGPPPELILLDLLMPVMDGFAFLREQKADPALAAVPVIVVTAASTEQAQAVAASAAGYLQKPVDVRDLTGLLRPSPPACRPGETAP
jgi:serine/threonine protein kinase